MLQFCPADLRLSTAIADTQLLRLRLPRLVFADGHLFVLAARPKLALLPPDFASLPTLLRGQAAGEGPLKGAVQATQLHLAARDPIAQHLDLFRDFHHPPHALVHVCTPATPPARVGLLCVEPHRQSSKLEVWIRARSTVVAHQLGSRICGHTNGITTQSAGLGRQQRISRALSVLPLLGLLKVQAPPHIRSPQLGAPQLRALRRPIRAAQTAAQPSALASLPPSGIHRIQPHRLRGHLFRQHPQLAPELCHSAPEPRLAPLGDPKPGLQLLQGAFDLSVHAP
mmetsp:Transcript_14059/g.49505  ORF Transcript_14059/g.49505 Transcript_14059/m.49505 type:complete len:283 (+) Transcript_14059:1103-1951(+)